MFPETVDRLKCFEVTCLVRTVSRSLTWRNFAEVGSLREEEKKGKKNQWEERRGGLLSRLENARFPVNLDHMTRTVVHLACPFFRVSSPISAGLCLIIAEHAIQAADRVANVIWEKRDLERATYQFVFHFRDGWIFTGDYTCCVVSSSNRGKGEQVAARTNFGVERKSSPLNLKRRRRKTLWRQYANLPWTFVLCRRFYQILFVKTGDSSPVEQNRTRGRMRRITGSFTVIKRNGKSHHSFCSGRFNENHLSAAWHFEFRMFVSEHRRVRVCSSNFRKKRRGSSTSVTRLSRINLWGRYSGANMLERFLPREMRRKFVNTSSFFVELHPRFSRRRLELSVFIAL